MNTCQILFVTANVIVTEAYVGSFSRKSAFLGQPAASPTFVSSTEIMRMDTEKDFIDAKARYNLDQLLHDSYPPSISISHAEAAQGMPWKSSIDPKYPEEEDLLYMPFWEWHMSFMKENLTNLRVMPCTNGKTDFSYNENIQKKARIVSLCASSSEYRKIRMTYYDAGENTQVYNAVFYPDPKYNLPVLGIDLLAFNRKKYLAIVDFQPLHENEEDHATTFEHRLQPIKEQYENLKGRMSSKFYDETQFFSQQMLFSRFEDESIISNELFPAFQSYVQTHLDLIREVDPVEADLDMVLKRQKAYDTYSAERDPATGLFTAMFGAEWAMDFVHDFLFSMSERPTTTRSSLPQRTQTSIGVKEPVGAARP
ncbi:hypothetical protein FisN_8Hh258 [Fistulifera solaris]|uniref:15,16-dihydrobiliverdin:ferredoxin oxidoreductase n=1 Tax=Fistulifera solaris TaxID=1519565 RepID=A0A1Z5JYB7_FISSO|nr:hypothetical protein FisN_8Hh258 [Fistulifera solaris]|eukprot:GAX19035.1 hypothetical protein FisN_8Hh258 [Fistulifera solaris]